MLSRYAPNAIVVGQYYRVTRRTPKPMSPMHTYIPVEVLEMPVEAGDVITKHTAPRGLDAVLCLESFADIIGPAYPEIIRVTVFEGILFNQQDGHMEGFDRFRPVRTMKHARKLQARYTEYRERSLERQAAYAAFLAGNIYIGKSYRPEAVSMAEAVDMGFGAGWYVRTHGNDVWSEVKSAYADGNGLIFGYRASRYRRNDGNGYGYKLLTETFHPSLHELIIRKDRPTFGPVVDAEGYQTRDSDVKVSFINAG